MSVPCANPPTRSLPPAVTISRYQSHQSTMLTTRGDRTTKHYSFMSLQDLQQSQTALNLHRRTSAPPCRSLPQASLNISLSPLFILMNFRETLIIRRNTVLPKSIRVIFHKPLNLTSRVDLQHNCQCGHSAQQNCDEGKPPEGRTGQLQDQTLPHVAGMGSCCL
jgi:hypothetical protein